MRATASAGVAAGVILMATLGACTSSVPGSAGISPPPAATTTAAASSITPTAPTATVDAKAALSKICSDIPAGQVASLFHSSRVKIAQDPVEQHGPWEATGCEITGSGELALTAFAQIGPPDISVQDGLNGITNQRGVSDVRQLTGIGEADAAVEFHQKIDSITENVVSLAKRTSAGTVVIGVIDAYDHGYQPLIRLASALAT
jgi:hypothetical protein